MDKIPNSQVNYISRSSGSIPFLNQDWELKTNCNTKLYELEYFSRSVNNKSTLKHTLSSLLY